MMLRDGSLQGIRHLPAMLSPQACSEVGNGLIDYIGRKEVQELGRYGRAIASNHPKEIQRRVVKLGEMG